MRSNLFCNNHIVCKQYYDVDINNQDAWINIKIYSKSSKNNDKEIQLYGHVNKFYTDRGVGGGGYGK